MKNKRATLINIFAALITLGVQMFISFWLSPFVVGKLGEEAYGFINLANNFVSYASLVSVAINSMACRYISVEYNSGNKEKAKSYFCSVFIANCFLYGLILIISILFVWKLEYIVNITAALMFQVKLTFLLSFVNMGTSLIGTVYTAAAFTTGEMHYNSIVQIVSNVIKSILILTLFSFLPAKVYYLSLDRNYFDFNKLKVLLKSGFWVLISNISNLLLNGLDLLFSNWFISSAIMGRLSLAKQIPLALSNALGVFSNIFSSALTKVFASDGNNKLVDEANSQLKILTMFFTVPYAGIIVFGYDFLKLWLSDTSYTGTQFVEIYILMILVLLDIIISTYMYSIHSIFIAIDKVRIYSVVLLVSSIISIATTLILLKCTGLGVYAIAGTSTVILGFTHGVIVPACAAKLLHRPIWTFWKTEFRSWVSLAIVCVVFSIVKNLMDFPNWISFFVNILIAGLIGYILEFILIFSKQEKNEIISIIELKLIRK